MDGLDRLILEFNFFCKEIPPSRSASKPVFIIHPSLQLVLSVAKNPETAESDYEVQLLDKLCC
jgi:hypothetical protein